MSMLWIQQQLHASLTQRSQTEKQENFSVDGNQNIKKTGNSSEQQTLDRDSNQKYGIGTSLLFIPKRSPSTQATI